MLIDYRNSNLTIAYLGLNFKQIVVEDNTEVIY